MKILTGCLNLDRSLTLPSYGDYVCMCACVPEFEGFRRAVRCQPDRIDHE